MASLRDKQLAQEAAIAVKTEPEVAKEESEEAPVKAGRTYKKKKK